MADIDELESSGRLSKSNLTKDDGIVITITKGQTDDKGSDSASTQTDTFTPRQNPLKRFSTYTYSLSLFMCTPEWMSAQFYGEIPDETQRVLLMRSGGSGTDDKHSSFFDNDFYMDELMITGVINSNLSATNLYSNSYEVKFRVFEPQGVTFLSRLTAQAYELNSRNDINYTQVPYLLEIKFYGYDSDGNMIAGEDEYGVIVKSLPLMITNIGFKLSSSSVVYDVEAVVTNTMKGNDLSSGTIMEDITISGNTVAELIGATLYDSSAEIDSSKLSDAKGGRLSLISSLNNRAFAMDMLGVNLYSYEVLIDSEIGNSVIDVNNLFGVRSKAIGEVDATGQPVIRSGDIATTTSTKEFQYHRGEKITNILTEIVKSSKYIIEQCEPRASDTDETENDAFKWLTINTEVIAEGYNTQLRAYKYRIRYIIRRRDDMCNIAVQAATPAPANKSTKCPPIYKKYDYWFTGQNTEIIELEQNFDAMYITAISIDDAATLSTSRFWGGYTGWSRNVLVSSTSGSTTQTTDDSKKMERVASFIDSLYSPANQAMVQFKIIGDPDYLFDLGLTRSVLLGNPSDEYVGIQTDGTFDPNHDLLFVIQYGNTVVDYDMDTGLAKTENSSGEDANFKNTKFGFLYKGTMITSEFNNGKFSQDIEGVMIHYPYECVLYNEPEIDAGG